MNPLALALLSADIVFLCVIARCVPWTRSAVIAWVLTGLVLGAFAFVSHVPSAVRLAVIALPAAWLVVIFFPDWSPFGPLSGAERRCQKVIHRVSAGARAAYQAGTLDAQRPVFIADLEALDPPSELWRAVKAAQLLDMREDPPQVGIGDSTERLVPWPWREAVDHRIVAVRLRLDDAFRARRVRRHPRPGFDEMTMRMRYDYFFLRILVARFEKAKAREGGLLRWHDEAAALLALGAEVRAPDASWSEVRDLILEVCGLELRGASSDLGDAELERFAVAREEARQTWHALELRDARGMASAG